MLNCDTAFSIESSKNRKQKPEIYAWLMLVQILAAIITCFHYVNAELRYSIFYRENKITDIFLVDVSSITGRYDNVFYYVNAELLGLIERDLNL
jgi:hypothetical protein